MGEVRLVDTGETLGYPYPVCKIIEVEITRVDCIMKYQCLRYQELPYQCSC